MIGIGNIQQFGGRAGGGVAGSVAFPDITGNPLANNALQPYLSSVTNLENNEFKYLYWQTISSISGTVTIPTGATVLLSEIEGLNALVETISAGKPSGNSPVSSGGSPVVIGSFDASGNYTLSGTPSAFPVAILFVFKIKAKDLSNISLNQVIADEQVGVMIGASASNNGKSGEVPQPLAGDQDKILTGNGLFRTINALVALCTDFRLSNARNTDAGVQSNGITINGGNGLQSYCLMCSKVIKGGSISSEFIMAINATYTSGSGGVGIHYFYFSTTPIVAGVAINPGAIVARDYPASSVSLANFSRIIYVNAAKNSYKTNDVNSNSPGGSTTAAVSNVSFNFNQDFYVVWGLINSSTCVMKAEHLRVQIVE